MAEYIFEPAELYFLLATFGDFSTTVVSQQKGFGETKVDADWIRTQWEIGFSQFHDKGWLTPDQDGKLIMDPAIALLGSIIADPTLAFSVSVNINSNLAQTVTYSLSETEYIEQSRLQNGQYRFVNLKNEDVMIDRIISILHLTGLGENLGEEFAGYQIPASEFSESVRLARIGRVEESIKLLAVYLGDIVQAQNMANFLLTSTRSAEIAVKVPGDRLAEPVGGLVLLKSAQVFRLLVHLPQSDSVMLETPSTHRVRFILHEWLNANAPDHKASVIRNEA